MKVYDASFLKKGEKNHWVKIGAGFDQPEGRINVVLDSIPLGQWDGRITLFPQGETKS